MKARLIAAWWTAEEAAADACFWLANRDRLLPALLAVVALAFFAGLMVS